MAGLRVLVTGAGGFIGRHVLAAAPASWDIVALSRDDAGTRHPTVRWTGRPEDPLPAKLGEPFDAIIHLAGNANHGLATREPWSDLIATAGVGAAVLGQVRSRAVVLLSSAAVYAGLDGRVDPSQCVDPHVAFALSKRYVEGFVHSLLATGAIDRAVVIRLYNAFGPGERPTRLVPRVVEALRAGVPFRMTADARSLSDPVHVDRVAEVLVKAVEGAVGGTFDLCGGDPRPMEEQIGRIASALGHPAPAIDRAPDPAETPVRFWSSPNPIVSTLGLDEGEPFVSAVRRYAREAGWL